MTTIRMLFTQNFLLKENERTSATPNSYQQRSIQLTFKLANKKPVIIKLTASLLCKLLTFNYRVCESDADRALIIDNKNFY